LLLDGTDDYVYSSDAEDDINFHTGDFSFEAWIYIENAPSSTQSEAIVFVGNNDDGEDDDEFQFGVRNTGSGTFLELCYDSCVGASNDKRTFTSNTLNDDTWYHVAISMDADGVSSGNPSHAVFIDGLRITGDTHAGTTFKPTTSSNYDASSSVQLGKGDLSGSSGASTYFSGMIDEARWSNHERHAFAGGLMISEVVPGSNTVKVYNSGSTTMTLTGVDIMLEGETTCYSFANGDTLAAETESSTLSCSINADDGIYLVDIDGDNSGTSDTQADADNRRWVIDGVCWNDDGSTTDAVCTAGQPLVTGGFWIENTAFNYGSNPGLKLTANGNNDEAVDDWAAIPEFGTLLMPVASVLMIVGYNYRRREQLES